MNVGNLRYKIELWGNVEFTNELLETDTRPEAIKSIWAEVIPQTGNMSKRQGVETIMTNVTHKFVVRYNSGKDITSDMWFLYRGHKFDIRFILNPYFSNEKLEIFCEEVVG
ncbi:phage head closure protein [Paenibacillus sp. Root444D2]|uniref:phage head closure protein n=1 Tax=Paenibacillus sp. Root444D2 TaxID=1736538 RepID=UPI00070A6BBB|nr:phage head closure protein [Paenibacillus sp. Root444D2]KQX69233.1 head-tail adaptor protein [Paenibacillus sp. Root444D2]